ncbi:hypothetical protein A6V39_05395 [Candidatus Mycoplasma haematobovis]|uniref:Uncharacterized protein n=1 Tax=Candidatus Mycoplasma haematobovis TaxID=432608 RepID=A0A1A9QDJ4_9MOLU|nr:hypothetical protein A6V39_05395 [Candidatus Mycoplasma haematobovis]
MIASLGGVKLNDTINFKRKILSYSRIPNQFKLSAGLVGKDLYFPDYTDDDAWKRTYETKYTGDIDLPKRRTDFLKDFSSWDKFRDYCYQEAEKGYETCNETQGFCMECARDSSWDWDKNRRGT